MKKPAFINGMSRTFYKTGFALKKHSPEILIVGGVIGAVTSCVMACVATTKVGEIIEDTKNTLDIIHEGSAKGEIKGKEYTQEDAKKDTTIVYAKTGLKIAKLYAPSVILGALSLTSIVTSNNILRQRNVALAAAYTTIDKSFKDYRGRVVDRFGKELDRELKYDIKAKEIEEKVVDSKGKEKTVKKTIQVAEGVNCSDYARFFDIGNPNWEKDSEFNLMFLRTQQQYANDLLQSKGHLFLNEVYDMLGIPRTKAGQSVGWVYDEKNPIGDNYVDFGIYDMYDQAKVDFVNGYERTILLDFNVDGPILQNLA